MRVSEFAEMRPVAGADAETAVDAYQRPANKRDLGHRCKYCRQPFSSLGAELVAEPEHGPTQRYHPECWRKHHNGAQRSIHGDLAMATSRSAREASKPRAPAAAHAPEAAGPGVVAAYVDEWKRAAMEPSRRRSRGSRQPRAGCPARASPLDGLISVEDEAGERRVARGFSKQAINVVVAQWASTAADTEDCAVCFACPDQAMRLPCGHVFCTQCVVPWLSRCSLCPMCRQDFHSQADIFTGMQPLPASVLPPAPRLTGIVATGAPGANRREQSANGGA